jgi:hypothetical protein
VFGEGNGQILSVLSPENVSLIPGQSKHEILGKPTAISVDGLVETKGRHAVQGRQIYVQDYSLASNRADQRCNGIGLKNAHSYFILFDSQQANDPRLAVRSNDSTVPVFQYPACHRTIIFLKYLPKCRNHIVKTF